MPSPVDLERHLARFRRLPRFESVWEGGVLSLPTWVEGADDQPPFRPVGAVWVSTTPRLGHFTMKDLPDGIDDGVLLMTLCEMGTSAKLAGHRPAVLRVGDERLATIVARALSGCDTQVEVVAELPALDAFIDAMAEANEEGAPGALDVPGVTLERLRAFADAARLFCLAAPWRHLDDGDLIRIELPDAGAGLGLCAVMGNGGQEFGIGFFSSEQRYRDMMAGVTPETLIGQGTDWAVYMSPPWELPMKDVLIWERHRLPLASDQQYPAAMRPILNGDPQRPDAAHLAYFEGLLRVLAATSESEMDSGRWSRQVQTSEGPATYVLTLPDLVDPERSSPVPPSERAMERITAEVSRAFGDRAFDSRAEFDAALRERFGDIAVDEVPSTAATPLERAQDLVYEAFDEGGRRQLQLIRQALALSPDCADAYVLLAERAISLDEARAFYEQGVAAGERAIGPGALDDPERAIWGDVTARPYLRARVGLAECLGRQGDRAGAVAHLRAVLELEPDDHLGARFRLLSVLLEAELDDQAEELLREHDDDGATWAYASLLLALRRKDRRVARSRLRDALRANRHVPRYLTGQRQLPDERPMTYVPGDADEAVLCAFELIGPWMATPGAAAWLRSEMRGRR